MALYWHTFYDIKVRSFIIGQKFPQEIESVSDIDFVESGFFFDTELFYSRNSIKGVGFEKGNYGLFTALMTYAQPGYERDVVLRWKTRNTLCTDKKLVSIETMMHFSKDIDNNPENIRKMFCPYFDKSAAVITTSYVQCMIQEKLILSNKTLRVSRWRPRYY